MQHLSNIYHLLLPQNIILKNSTRFTPYIGVGATVIVPWDEELSQTTKTATGAEKLDADVAYGVAGQVGFNFQPADAKKLGCVCRRTLCRCEN